MGDAASHLRLLRVQRQHDPDPTSRLASSIAMTLLYQDSLSPEDIAEEHRAVCAPIEQAVGARLTFPPGDPHKRLRIGLLTGDLHRQHPVNLFMLPVLQNWPAEGGELTVYHTGSMFDDYTRRAQAAAKRWAEVKALTDPQLVQRIRDDAAAWRRSRPGFGRGGRGFRPRSSRPRAHMHYFFGTSVSAEGHGWIEFGSWGIAPPRHQQRRRRCGGSSILGARRRTLGRLER
jgi:hypothetical protein